LKVLTKLLAASFKQFVRERAALFWTFAFPLIFILIFGGVFSGTDDITFSVGLVVKDKSPIAQGLTGILEQVPAFTLSIGDEETELQALKGGDRRAVIVVPSDFGAAVAQGDKGTIDVYYDPTQSSSQQVLLPIIRRVLDEFDRTLGQTPSLIQLNEKTLQIREIRAIDYLVPGILAMALMQLGLFAAEPLVVERENRVLKRLGATPLSRSTMILSTVIFRLLIALCQGALIIVVAMLVFDVPMMGNWVFLAGMVILGTLTFLAMGYMVSAFTKTQEAVMPLLMALQFPMMFLSGIFFPVEFMPGFMRPIMNAMPLTYLGDSLRQIMVNSSPLHSHLINAAVLGGWFVVCLVIAVRFFKWE
jgi:ABC-2 type transport system permease protein